MNATVLIVEDEDILRRSLAKYFKGAKYTVLEAGDGEAAVQLFEERAVDVVVLDLKLPGMDGLAVLKEFKAREPSTVVIMMTAYGTVDKAVEAMQKGAYSYILKPFDNERLVIYVNKAISMFRVVKENRQLRDAVKSHYSFGNILGKSKVMQDVYETIRKVAPTNATVLIEGESGTGKELVAKSIHFNSQRREKPFVAVNCSALAESLLESELFGHEKGAFTGAVTMKKGRFELADLGTLFLDEIGDLSSGLQVKLLRVLQEKVFERVGGVRTISINIRIIVATNKNLKQEMKYGRFREDLFYRLNVVLIGLPSLKQRKEDIHLLVNHFINKYAQERKSGTPVTGVDQSVERLFYDYSWPGNVRELENVIERAMILSPGENIKVSDLPTIFRASVNNTLPLEGIPAGAKLYETLAMIEKAMIKRALRISNHVQSHAAELLGIGKSGLNQKIKKFNLDIGTKH